MFTLEMWTAADFSDLSTPLYLRSVIIFILCRPTLRRHIGIQKVILLYFLNRVELTSALFVCADHAWIFFKRYTYNKCFSAYLIYIMQYILYIPYIYIVRKPSAGSQYYSSVGPVQFRRTLIIFWLMGGYCVLW